LHLQVLPATPETLEQAAWGEHPPWFLVHASTHVHTAAPGADSNPTEHLVHDESPDLAYEFAGQGVHLEAPSVIVTEPSLHLEHSSAPAMGE
jgi:hypothetical protein